MPGPEEILTERFQAAISQAFGEGLADVDPLVRPTPDPRFGDYQANVAMSLAGRLEISSREVAEAIVARLDVSDLAHPSEVAGPGFINLTFTEEFLAGRAAALATDQRLGVETVSAPETVVVDYSSPNAARELHVGHLRSTVIGDALVRTLELLGHRVIRQSHVGDWGTQFGMLVEHLLEMGDQTVAVDDLNELYRQAQQRFDSDPQFAERARRRVVALQSGDEQSLSMWRRLVLESYRHFDAVYRRLGVSLEREDADPESSYNPMLPKVVSELEEKGLTQLSDGAVCVFLPGFVGKDGEPLPMITRKSDGGYLYATTDLAALRHRIFELGADRVIYVTDARQAQHFAMLFAAARLAGWLEEGVRLEHCPFGTILGRDGRPFRTRAGESVKLSDLLEEAEHRAAAIVTEKDPELGPLARAEVAHVVGIGALKYADLQVDRVKDYVFSWDRMLAMDGNTAPYLQYAYTRIRSIFRKGGLEEPPLAEGLVIAHPEERALVLHLLRLPEVVRAVGETLQPHRLCAYLYELATTFNTFYERCPVLQAERPVERDTRLVLCDLTARALQLGLGLLGIEVVERM